MTKQVVTIEKIQIQGFRAYLRPQNFTLTNGKTPLSLAIFGPNAKGKSSLVDSFEFFFSEDATLSRLGKRTYQTHAGPAAMEHVEARETGIESSVHFWFSRKGEKFDAARTAGADIPEAAKQILSTIKVPFVIRGHALRRFVEDTTPGEQYKELANWFGLDPLLNVQRNLKALRRKLKERSESTSEADERSRDLSRETGGIVSEWKDKAVCDWLNRQILGNLDSSLTFSEISQQDPAFAILTCRRDDEHEKVGLKRLKGISRQLEELASPLDGSKSELAGGIPTFEKAAVRFGKAVIAEKAERLKAKDAVFSHVWTEAHRLFDSNEVRDRCPICDASFAAGPHGSRDGVRISISDKLCGLGTYRDAEGELRESRKCLELSIGPLKSSVDAVRLALEESSYPSEHLADYYDKLSGWSIGSDSPDSQGVMSALRSIHTSVAKQVTRIERQQGDHTYGKAFDIVSALIRIKADLQRISRTKGQLKLLQRELNRQVLAIDQAIVSHIQGLMGKLQSDVESIYQEIQGSASTSPPIRIDLPGQEGIDQQKAQLLIDFSDNRQGVVPGGYLSDSQVHTLALSLRLAAIRMFNSAAPILVLDDVVTSYDADHRKTIVGAIAKHLSDFQIVLVTHDEQFFNLLKDQMPPSHWTFRRITEIRSGVGPVFHDHQTSDEVIEARLKEGKGAGELIRQAEEEWLMRICREFGARVTIRPIERAFQYDRAELADALATLLKGAKIKMPKTTVQNSFLLSLQSGVVENLSSHFSDNPYKSGSVGDDRARWEEFKYFRGLFKCPACDKRRFKRPMTLTKPVCNYCETPFAFSLP